MAESGKEMTIIVTPKVHERFIEEMGNRLNELIRRGNVNYMLLSDSAVTTTPSMTLTDLFAYIYFFNTDGVYDNKIIVSDDDMMRAWAKELYKFYKKKAAAVES
ncbi:MAG: DUF1724 domain-containing protein [Methanimicrococcus sp.]|nr:DUF1724 domain-containing protein [Methanimicrococcus sp.]